MAIFIVKPPVSWVLEFIANTCFTEHRLMYAAFFHIRPKRKEVSLTN